MTAELWRQHSVTLGRLCAVGLGISLPFSTALDNVLLGLILLCWLASGDFVRRWEQLRQHPLAWVTAAFFALFALGMAYGEARAGDRLHYFNKYADVLLIAVLITLFNDAVWRRRAWFGFAGSIAVLLILSYLIRFGIIPPNPWLHGTPENPIVFKEWITHGILVAFGAFLFALLGLHEARPRWRMAWWLLAALAVGNTLFIMQGRTGHLVLAILALYLGYAWRRGIGLALAAAGFAAVAAIAFITPSAMHNRSEVAVKEFAQAQPGIAAQTSIGLRLEYYRNTLAIIGAHPLLGVGTGGFPLAYQQQVAGTTMEAARNPHNQYLLCLAQLGLCGLLVVLALWWTPWHFAPQLPTAIDMHLARGMVLTLAVGCLFNSLLLDHTEGLWFAWGIGVLFGGLQLSTSPSQPARS